MSIFTWDFLVVCLPRERAKLSPMLRQTKGSLAGKPSGEKAKATPLAMLLSGHSMINCSASLNVCEEDDDGHQVPQTVTFTTGSPPVLHKTWRSVQDKTYQSNQVRLSSTSTVHTVKGEFSHSGSAAKGILCSVHFCTGHIKITLFWTSAACYNTL